MARDWTTAGFTVKERELEQIKEAARDRGMTPNALLYAIFWNVTQNFSQFDIPEKLPRKYRTLKEASND